MKSLIGPAVIVGTSLWVLYKYARFKWAVAKGFNAPNLEPPSFPLGNLLLLGCAAVHDPHLTSIIVVLAAPSARAICPLTTCNIAYATTSLADG